MNTASQHAKSKEQRAKYKRKRKRKRKHKRKRIEKGVSLVSVGVDLEQTLPMPSGRSRVGGDLNDASHKPVKGRVPRRVIWLVVGLITVVARNDATGTGLERARGCAVGDAEAAGV